MNNKTYYIYTTYLLPGGHQVSCEYHNVVIINDSKSHIRIQYERLADNGRAEWPGGNGSGKKERIEETIKRKDINIIRESV